MFSGMRQIITSATIKLPPQARGNNRCRQHVASVVSSRTLASAHSNQGAMRTRPIRTPILGQMDLLGCQRGVRAFEGFRRRELREFPTTRSASWPSRDAAGRQILYLDDI